VNEHQYNTYALILITIHLCIIKNLIGRCCTIQRGGLWWLDPGHDPMVTMTRRPDFAYIYTTRRYAVPAAAGVTLNAGHISDLVRGGGCIQPTTPFFTGAGPLPRVIPLVAAPPR
jgi:hypothetical protein